MSYSYQAQRAQLFTDDGQRLFLGIRDNVRKLIASAGAFRAMEAMTLPSGVVAADSWDFLACLDRMVELGEIKEIQRPNVAGQYRVFVAAWGA